MIPPHTPITIPSPNMTSASICASWVVGIKGNATAKKVPPKREYAMWYPYAIITKGSIAPTTPIIIPSVRKGQRMNQLVAPTSFMISISRRLEKMVILMVFEIRNIAMTTSPTTNTMPMSRTVSRKRNSLSTTSCPSSTRSTPGSARIF